uniref:Caveolin n=1 Tax=Leptobrachium leishanense TaxID=445787 RepID=A0A8C5MDD2_9ANUR
MGLEKEKSDARIFMDLEDLNPSSIPMITEKTYNNSPNRDPQNLNGQLKVNFEDVIAEPETTHSFDKVWICSTAIFEISKYVVYKVLTLLLAIPLVFILGILFAIGSCLHIWIIMPIVKTFLMLLPSVRAIWKGVMDSLVAPLYASMGLCFSSVKVHLDKN